MTVKILVVDDSTTMRKIIQMTFAAENAQVETADGAEAALAKLDSFGPDLVFADLSMSPDGYELAKTVKSRRPTTAVVALSSQHSAYDAAKGGAAGIDDNIVKPFDTQSVIDRVAQVLARPRVPATAFTLAGVPTASPGAAPAAPRPPLSAPGSSAAIPLAASPRDMKRTMAFGMPLAPVSNPVGPVQGGSSPGTVPMPTMNLGNAMPLPTVPSATAPSNPAPVVPKPQSSAPGPAPMVPKPAAPAPAAAAPAPAVAAPAAPAAPKPAPVATPAPAPVAATAAPVAAPKPAAPAPAAAPSAAPAVAAVAGAVVSATLSNKLAGLGLTKEQVEGVLALSREVVEQVVWEVVPELAEVLIKEEIKRLTAG